MKNKNQPAIRSSAVEYLTLGVATGDDKNSIEVRYEDENIWITQKMLAALYEVDVRTINYHILKIFEDNELQEDSVIRNFRITATDGKSYNTNHYSLQMFEYGLLRDAGKVTVEIAKLHAESEFEKYRIIQDRLFKSDYDRCLEELENESKILKQVQCKEESHSELDSESDEIKKTDPETSSG